MNTFLIILFIIVSTVFIQKVNGDYQNTYPSISSILPSPTISCTPTPYETPFASPSATQTPTQEVQINTGASANNTAGSSATVSMPISAPNTGRSL